MTDQELERRLQEAMEHAAPDVLEQILSSCDQQKGPVISMTNPKRKNGRAPLMATAAALVVVLSGALGYGWHTANAADARILLDVNPSLSITVNAKERVLSVDPLNDDAEAIIGGMNLKGSQLEVAVNALIGSMVQNGYLDELQNSILVSVENHDAAKAEQLQQKVTAAISTPLAENGLEPAVLSQNVSEDEELASFARQYGISVGKAALIREITAQDQTLAVESLTPMTVNELSLILTSRGTGTGAVTQTGTASSKAYISQDEAKEAAFFHAGVEAKDVSRCEIEFDSEDGLMVYELEFFAGTTEYEYDIDARSAAVVHFSSEDKDPGQAGGNVSSHSGIISKEQVKTIALQKAGVPASAVTGLQVELDQDDSSAKYEITFHADGKKYEMEIDAISGSVLECSAEGGGSTSAGSKQLTETEAKAAAFRHAGVKESAVSGLKVELDRGTLTTKYELEFWAGGSEYDYEIDAYTGKVLEYSVEKDDSAGSSQGRISEDQAKSIAFQAAGIKASAAAELKVSLDEDDGKMVYEIGFKVGEKRFECEVDAASGRILTSEWDD